MSLSSYLFGIRFFTLLTVSAWMGIIFLFDPEEMGSTAVTLFFLVFFVAWVGIFLLLLISLYRKMSSDDTTVANLMGIIRQAILLSFFLTGMLLFQYMHILVWWDASLLFALILLLEFTFRYLSHTNK
ncbi:MAG: hypothetical protein GW815_01205 [Candidatus Moranbacteria bacterium]|nr:hypothetical protein [Candidatus Moranbacteria bacterium]OIQ03064.1 MAG: hypothetical protein AUK58_02015 [Candidatus Moranbacteria bacterium CG2_30_41_165]PIP25713.1 MAG: hypothetical protein COX32_02065 [Candidatus Moranbacteria bacterium CG23_combo_of_CG06-09_8_20_14_all_41_28]PIV86065.1 MAG: hypothetical protein COW50_03380 [Candidatus Moranbacteria bacterium CG17_big_fil_post_rev_8_21_14_2_50_41_107]PIW94017.1 MAG: hypothetical protein COZ86_03040 [Candidatus Moranbacteria bacterium CG_